VPAAGTEAGTADARDDHNSPWGPGADRGRPGGTDRRRRGAPGHRCGGVDSVGRSPPSTPLPHPEASPAGGKPG